MYNIKKINNFHKKYFNNIIFVLLFSIIIQIFLLVLLFQIFHSYLIYFTIFLLLFSIVIFMLLLLILLYFAGFTVEVMFYLLLNALNQHRVIEISSRHFSQFWQKVHNTLTLNLKIFKWQFPI